MSNNFLERRSHKIAIVGTGKVGTSFAYALLLSGLVGEIVLIDIDKVRTEGEVMDLNHAVPLTNPALIYQGDYADCEDAEVIVISAGTAQKPGETRLNLFRRNTTIFKDIIPKITTHNQNGILLIATNPVDILSYVSQKVSGWPASRVIGSGTILDTSRFRFLLSKRFSLDARNVHAFIIGEHGDSEIAVWSLANISGMPLEKYCESIGCTLDTSQKKEISDQVKNAAYEIISRKGSTHYAVAVGLVRIVESILRNQNSLLSVSNLVPGYYGLEDVYLSLPAIVGENGIGQILKLPLSNSEEEAFIHSAQVLKDILQAIEI